MKVGREVIKDLKLNLDYGTSEQAAAGRPAILEKVG
jgi:hypothetical protein